MNKGQTGRKNGRIIRLDAGAATAFFVRPKLFQYETALLKNRKQRAAWASGRLSLFVMFHALALIE
ncbi:hypothetical protein EDM54_16840 [Brevibacillus borstelensis]|jgi:hypothetical protein|uniref:Uncharacterized protein n=1 Tax=Brevibacillus borstelensis AK1 TaxID=1300222 RepID=M8D5K6_9BACL|nr:hypothetical protein I532_16583 [Brevibacillus borstelensis AK1]KKX56551.1 hypothetical protein X546_03920 [Brevibacillus borstelensis cifa_chp40]RNB61891.1 hypothetical protein EDM54_16840 [Brevibacillus borstelensis]